MGRVVVLSDIDGPISPALSLANRDCSIEQKAADWKHLILPSPRPKSWEKWLRDMVEDWLDLPCLDHSGIQKVGSLVSLTESDDEASLFISGKSNVMKALVDELDSIKRQYRSQIGSKVGERRAKVREVIEEFLAAETPDEDYCRAVGAAMNGSDKSATVRRSFVDASPEELPRVLILGPSGSGKSFVSRYLARRTSVDDSKQTHRPLKRVPIPEYLDNEQRLEFELFGYMRGAYTDARQSGSPGIMLSYLGGMVFLDEIGDASPALQAKLLAFMDDYRVSPRGWHGEGIFCPLMIVAATNRPVDRWAEQDEIGESLPTGQFRHDLFHRFTHVIRLSGLNDRKEDLPMLVDCLLQQKSVNPGKRVIGIRDSALVALKAIDYERGNFRKLRCLLRLACERASRRKTPVIHENDIVTY